MRAHVGFDEGGTSLGDDRLKRRRQFDPAFRILDQGNVMGWLAITASHDYHAVIGEPCLFRKGAPSLNIRDHGMTEVGIQRGVMANKFEPGFAIVEHDDLPRQGTEWNIGMRAEAAFAGQPNLSFGRHVEHCGDLGTRRIKLGSRPRDIPGERPKYICVEPGYYVQSQAKEPFGQRSNGSLLAMHGRKKSAITAIEQSLRRPHQK